MNQMILGTIFASGGAENRTQPYRYKGSYSNNRAGHSGYRNKSSGLGHRNSSKWTWLNCTPKQADTLCCQCSADVIHKYKMNIKLECG